MKKRFRLLFIFLTAWLLPAAVVRSAVAPPRPALAFSTLLGGALSDRGTAVAVDGAGNVYVAGITESTMFPAPAAAPEHGVDAFVAKVRADGTALDYLFWFNAVSASDVDEGLGIAVDAAGNAYVTGQTRSADFCALFGDVPGYDTRYNESSDAFLLKIEAGGAGLAYCTFLGGGDWDVGRAVAVDDAGAAVVVGSTWSADFPVTAAAEQAQPGGQRDVFVARFDPSGTQLTYASYYGGSGQEDAQALALDAAGRVTLAGWTNSPDLPLSAAPFDSGSDGFDAFVAAFAADHTLRYATYLGGSAEDRAFAAAVTADGLIVVAGQTSSTDFPTTANAPQRQMDGAADAFVTYLDPRGGAPALSTYFGNEGVDEARGLALNAAGEATIAGSSATQAGSNAFVLRLGRDGRLLRQTVFGGSDNDQAAAVALAPRGIILTGATRSADFPTTAGAFATAHGGDYDAFVLRLTDSALYLPLVRR